MIALPLNERQSVKAAAALCVWPALISQRRDFFFFLCCSDLDMMTPVGIWLCFFVCLSDLG
jgi:hypothetical protein